MPLRAKDRRFRSILSVSLSLFLEGMGGSISGWMDDWQGKKDVASRYAEVENIWYLSFLNLSRLGFLYFIALQGCWPPPGYLALLALPVPQQLRRARILWPQWLEVLAKSPPRSWYVSRAAAWEIDGRLWIHRSRLLCKKHFVREGLLGEAGLNRRRKDLPLCSLRRMAAGVHRTSHQRPHP